MRTEAEIRRALEVMMKFESDAVGMGGNTELIGAIFVGTLRFVLNEKGSPWPKWLEDLEKAQAAMSTPTDRLPDGYYWVRKEDRWFPAMWNDGVWFHARWDPEEIGKKVDFEIGNRIEEPK